MGFALGFLPTIFRLQPLAVGESDKQKNLSPERDLKNAAIFIKNGPIYPPNICCQSTCPGVYTVYLYPYTVVVVRVAIFLWAFVPALVPAPPLSLLLSRNPENVESAHPSLQPAQPSVRTQVGRIVASLMDEGEQNIRPSWLKYLAEEADVPNDLFAKLSVKSTIDQKNPRHLLNPKEWGVWNLDLLEGVGSL